MGLWNDQKNRKGDEIPESLINNNQALLKKIQQDYLTEVFKDTLGYTGARMIRRLVGVAHIHDMDSIADKDKRAECERKALKMGTYLVKNWQKVKDIDEVVKLAWGFKSG